MKRRIGGMRKTLTVLVVATAALAVTGTAGGDRAVSRISVPGGLSVRVPARWHVLRGWLSDVTDPAPRLAVASFLARLSRHTCACGFPNVINFPQDGAFVFVWEYLNPSRGQLARTRARPVRFALAAGAVRHTCNGPSDGFAFKDGGRVFQVEVYVGHDVGSALREQAATILASLRVAPSARRG